MSDIADKLLRGKVLYRDVVGRKVRLLRAFSKVRRGAFRKGDIVQVEVTHRGTFTLKTLDEPGEWISHIGPAYFELVEETDK